MPKFILDKSFPETAKRFDEQSSFVQGYIEAMFFTECHSDNPELEHMTIADLSEEAWKSIVKDCDAFKYSCPNMLALAYQQNDYDEVQAGRDFWYTRNGHGVGFWDREQLKTNGLGQALSNAAKRFSEANLYLGDDGSLHHE
jgi:hypothetical protein